MLTWHIYYITGIIFILNFSSYAIPCSHIRLFILLSKLLFWVKILIIHNILLINFWRFKFNIYWFITCLVFQINRFFVELLRIGIIKISKVKSFESIRLMMSILAGSFLSESSLLHSLWRVVYINVAALNFFFFKSTLF